MCSFNVLRRIETGKNGKCHEMKIFSDNVVVIAQDFCEQRYDTCRYLANIIDALLSKITN
ncbi:hypothetical protein V1478_002088 [Vespula squamosa]|uniref:Uncharacterized protein n=1 Tax=Vespula squamosa TaxID=30214 RepID=A0ABD2BYY9_VESSQ